MTEKSLRRRDLAACGKTPGAPLLSSCLAKAGRSCDAERSESERRRSFGCAARKAAALRMTEKSLRRRDLAARGNEPLTRRGLAARGKTPGAPLLPFCLAKAGRSCGAERSESERRRSFGCAARKAAALRMTEKSLRRRDLAARGNEPLTRRGLAARGKTPGAPLLPFCLAKAGRSCGAERSESERRRSFGCAARKAACSG